MTGASPAVPIGHRHQHHHRPRGRRHALADLWTLAAAWPGGHGPGGHHRHGPGFGPPWFGPGRGGRRARRGDVRAALLLLLAEEPRNGYGLMQELEQRSAGTWRPSPGSVYPALAQLEDEGLVRSVEREGKRVFELTDAGRAHVEERREQLGTPWADAAGGASDELQELRSAAGALAAAALQVAQTGTAAQLQAARRVLDDARRALYRILAEDAPADEVGDDARDA